jgi:hypothetical protein
MIGDFILIDKRIYTLVYLRIKYFNGLFVKIKSVKPCCPEEYFINIYQIAVAS